MQVMIDEEYVHSSADFLPQYPFNGWPIFQGLFNTFYIALDDLCEFKAPNVLKFGVGKWLRASFALSRGTYLEWAQLPWSPEQLQSWFEFQGKKQQLGNSWRYSGNMTTFYHIELTCIWSTASKFQRVPLIQSEVNLCQSCAFINQPLYQVTPTEDQVRDILK